MILLYLDMFTKETRRLFLYEYREIRHREFYSPIPQMSAYTFNQNVTIYPEGYSDSYHSGQAHFIIIVPTHAK